MVTDIFCKIINGEISAEIFWQDEDFLVIKDIHPQAPVHLLIISKRHIGDLKEVGVGDSALLGKIFLIAEQVAKQAGISESGYRLIINEGEHAGKLVPHLHVHLLGGKELGAKIVQ
ncbi:MAG: histidine triad nucleotide-binding protein [Patescibacteria group bacterium]